MQYKIIVDKQPRTNPSSDKRQYVIDIEELRYLGDIYDSLIITKDADYVIRKLSLSEYGVLSVLDKEVIEPIDNINIELFEGDNYIYLADMTGNYIYAEYLLKNEFTDMYITEAEMNTAIKQTEKTITLSVNQKLTSYSTKQETKSEIELATESINLSVDKKLEDYSTTEEMNAQIDIKADGITSSVSKTYATKDEVYSSVGTVNLVNNSDFSHKDESDNYDLKNWTLQGDISESDKNIVVEENDKTWFRLYSPGNFQYNKAILYQDIKPATSEDYYTVSFKLKNNNISYGNFDRKLRLDVHLVRYYTDGSAIDDYNAITIQDNEQFNYYEEQKFELIFSPTTKEGLTSFRLSFETGSNFEEIFDSSITDIQVEKGQIATEWRPSQTDFYYQVEQYSKVTQTVEELQSEVGKKVGEDEIISKINQSAEAVTIDANRVSLNRKNNKFNIR